MLYLTPDLSNADIRVIESINVNREELKHWLRAPRRWHGTLRRATLARAVQGSNSIEGINASAEDIAALIDDEEPMDADQETRHAIVGYRDAMTFIMSLAREHTPLNESLVKSLHFMLMKYDLKKNPGQWRPKHIWVEGADGEVVYTAPDRELVDSLMLELMEAANKGDGNAMVRAAMAHLNLALIHPFSDGNGRMARCIQSYVLAFDGEISPEFLSIEEYLGRNTPAYYKALADTAAGSWSPHRSTSPWIKFCLTAHYQQALLLLRRIREMEVLWNECDRLVREHNLPERSIAPLCDAARGWRLHRSLYKKVILSADGAEITDETATRDLRSLTAAGLLVPVGEKRGRTYLPSPALSAIRVQIRLQRPAAVELDPYLGA